MESVSQHNHVKRANEDIGPRVRRGQLTFLSRKIYNLLIYRAQESGKAGKGLPLGVTADCDSSENYWWIPLTDLIHDAKFKSKATDYIREAFMNLQSVVVDRFSKNKWESDQILGSVKILSGQTAPGSSKLYVGFQFPSAIEDALLTPSLYTRMSIFYQSKMKSEASLVLYEICKRFATCPGGLTARGTWQEWAERMSVRAATTEYKYFKRDILNRAMQEVNGITDIDIELIEFKEARFVKDIQFKVRETAQQKLNLPTAPAIDADALMAMEEFGISMPEAERLADKYNSDEIKATAKLVHQRMEDASKPPIESAAAYFKTALVGKWAKAGIASIDKKKAEAEAAAAARKASSQAKLEAEIKIQATPLPEGEALALAWSKFCESPDSKHAKLSKMILPDSFEKAGKIAQTAFKAWLAKV